MPARIAVTDNVTRVVVATAGAPGPTGPAGPGLPPGGTVGQVPIKASATDYDSAWGDIVAADASPHYWEGLAWITNFRSRIINGSGGNIVLTGDSTTFGQYVAVGYKPDQHLRQLKNDCGAFNQNFYNRGQSGQDTTSWLSTYLAGDITNGGNTPHLIIARWGANDPAVSGNTAAQAAANYGTAIDTIRASLSATACNILIMTPGPMFDTPNGRDAEYFEELAGLLRTVAREKQCAFFDSYQYLKDGDGLAGTTYDDPFADGREIHPNEAVISLLYDEVARVLFGGLGAAKKNHFWNQGSFDRTLLPTAGAADFDFGLFCDRAVNTDGWGRNGYALTLRPVDGTAAMQHNWGFADGDPTVQLRLYQSGAWLDWLSILIRGEAANVWTGTSQNHSITPKALFDAAAVQTLTYGATITPNFGSGLNFKVTLGGNGTLANPTNAKNGQSGTIRVIQDATGSRTLAYGSNWRFPGGAGTGGVLSTGANAIDLIAYTVQEDGTILATLSKAFAA